MASEVIEQDEGASETAALAKLPRDLAIIKMQNESIMGLAAARPRDHAGILADIRQQLVTYKSFCKAAFYNKPVGKDPDTGIMKYARGPSIRMAEALADAYGFNRVAASVAPIDEMTVRIEASFFDYQRGKVWSDDRIVSKRYKTRHGATRIHSDDRFYNVVVQAEKSKLIREVIMRSVPPGLRSEFELIVNEQLDAFLDDATVNKLIAAFAGKNVSKEMLERHFGKRIDALTKEDRKMLMGIWTAIDTEETTVAEVFGDAPKPEPAARPDGQSKGDDLAERIKAAQGPTVEPPEEPAAPEAPSDPPAADTPVPAPADTATPEHIDLKHVKSVSPGEIYATRFVVDKANRTHGTIETHDGATVFTFTYNGKMPDAIQPGVSVIVKAHNRKSNRGVVSWIDDCEVIE